MNRYNTKNRNQTALHLMTIVFLSIICLPLASCEPNLTKEIIINIEPSQAITSQYTKVDLDRDVHKTLEIIKRRLTEIGAFYGDKQIENVKSNNEYTYRIKFPEKANIKSLTRIITNPGII